MCTYYTLLKLEINMLRTYLNVPYSALDLASIKSSRNRYQNLIRSSKCKYYPNLVWWPGALLISELYLYYTVYILNKAILMLLYNCIVIFALGSFFDGYP